MIPFKDLLIAWAPLIAAALLSWSIAHYVASPWQHVALKASLALGSAAALWAVLRSPSRMTALPFAIVILTWGNWSFVVEVLFAITYADGGFGG